MPRHFTIRPIRPPDAAAVARVHVTSWEETYRGLLPDAVIDRAVGPGGIPMRWRERLTSTAPNPYENRVAIVRGEDGREEVVGFVSAGPSRWSEHDPPGEVLALYLVGSHQDRGIGRALWDAAVGALAARELLPGLVWVLAENPTIDFYRHVGAVEFTRRPCRIPEAEHLVEVGLRFGDGV